VVLARRAGVHRRERGGLTQTLEEEHVRHGLSVSTVMAAKMTAGSAVLVAYSGVTGRLVAVAHLTGLQWRFVL
jgi:hypothetical protein